MANINKIWAVVLNNQLIDFLNGMIHMLESLHIRHTSISYGWSILYYEQRQCLFVFALSLHLQIQQLVNQMV